MPLSPRPRRKRASTRTAAAAANPVHGQALQVIRGPVQTGHAVRRAGATENLDDLHAFVAVAQARSFTRAAARLGMSRSALSHAMTALEARLGVRLLHRTTRSVAASEAGARLLQTLVPMFGELDAQLASLRAQRETPAGRVRITATSHAIVTVLWPKLRELLRQYPEIQVELSVDYGLADIVAQHFDAGVRSGDRVDKDMIAVRIGPDLRMAVVGAPAYLAQRPAPKKPRDLAAHNCINLRLPTLGGLYAWDFESRGKATSMRVQGQAVFNDTFLMRQAALDGLGLAYVPIDIVQPDLEAGRLVPVLEGWWPRLPGLHLYYASRRQVAPALARVIEALRHRG